MSETDEQPDDSQSGWVVYDPDGHLVASGPQTVLEASADAGDLNGSD